VNEREEVVRGAIDAFNAGDMARVVEYVHPEMMLRQLLPEVGLTSHESVTGVYRGSAEVERALSDAVDSFGGMRFEIRWVEEIGDDGALYELLALIGPEAERSAQIAWYLSRFRDGLVLSTTAFNTEAMAREAIARGD
jgi:SnoaL-like domain